MDHQARESHLMKKNQNDGRGSGNGSDAPRCIIGHMKRWRKTILYRKIRLVGLILGLVVAGVAGGPCNWLPSIKLRFRKGIEKLYGGNQLHLAIFHRKPRERALHNFNKITI
jgi:hypothetical protein